MILSYKLCRKLQSSKNPKNVVLVLSNQQFVRINFKDYFFINRFIELEEDFLDSHNIFLYTKKTMMLGVGNKSLIKRY